MMDDPLSRGRPFELGDLWQTSSFGFDDDATVFFQPQLLALEEFTLDNEAKLELPSLALPDLTDLNFDVSESSDDGSGNFGSAILAELADGSGGESHDDFWTLDLDLDSQVQPPQVHTWESFDRKAVLGLSKTRYLPESGPFAFSAALRRQPDHSKPDGVLPQPAILRALSNLVLGRSSTLFQWDEKESMFVTTLPDVPICGLSDVTSRSVITTMVAMGSMYRKLDNFACSSSRSKGLCPAAIALKSCVADVMTGIEMKLSSGIAKCRSILQLQRLTGPPSEVLKIMSHLMDCAKPSEEQTISAISEAIERRLTASSKLNALLESILARVCAPWLDSLCVDIGLQPTMLAPNTSEPYTAQTTEGAFDWQSSRQSHESKDMPTFVNAESRELINATRESMGMVRKYLPLSGYALHGAALPSEAFLNLSTRSSVTAEQAESGEYAYRLDGEDFVWSDETKQQYMFTLLGAQMAGAVPAPTNMNDSFTDVLQQCLDEKTHVGESHDLSSSLLSNPLNRLRPSIVAHQQLLSTALVQHLLLELRLRHHLDLQRQFHLLGNGDFITRLSQALFSSDTQTAQRRRGIVPTSEVLGLRLDRRDSQTWPPASSELGLTLMGVLTEAYGAETHGRLRREDQTLPGGLSFSVRELPENEIDRVMDPDSLYALDFLRLQYTAAPCLDIILSPSTLQMYDDIFRFLLRLLRVRHVVSKLREHLLFQRRSQRVVGSSIDAKDASRIQFAMEAYDALTILNSYFMDIGIESSWRVLNSLIGRVERNLSDDASKSQETAVGLDDLRRLHEEYLERIRTRLFLRRKQEKMRVAVENVLVRTLACALSMEKAAESMDTTSFGSSLAELSDAVRSAIDKHTKASAADEGDVEAMKILLTKLRWNEERNGKTDP